MRRVKIYAGIILLMVLTKPGLTQQLRLGNNPYTVEKSAVLELVSNNQGLLLPRITDTSLINTLNPPDGMMIFFTPAKKLFLRTNGSWIGLTTVDSVVTSVNGNRGALTMDTTYISNFYSKVRSLFSATTPITFSNGQIGISQATTSTNGYLSSTDWNTFNNKLSASRLINTTAPLAGGGDLTADRTLSINNNGISNSLIRQSVALSVMGNSTNATANVDDITAGTDGFVLRRSGTTLDFGTIATAGITNSAVTYSKIQNVTATNRLLGRATAGAGVMEEITLGTGLSYSGTTLNVGSIPNSSLSNSTIGLSLGSTGTDANVSGSPASLGGSLTLNIPSSSSVNRGLLTSTDWTTFNNKLSASRLINTTAPLAGGGDLTADRTLSINNNGISNSLIRQSAALSVMGNSTNATANVDDITAGTDGFVLRRSGTTLDFGTIATAGITNSAVTYSKIQNVTATNRLLGRATAGAGVMEEITLGTGLSYSGTTLNVGSIPNSSLSNSTIGLSLGSTGTDANVSGSPASLGGSLTLNIPSSSSVNRGLLTSADWITFNSKQPSGNYMTDPGGNGIVTRTALNTTINRTITGTTNRISLTNGDGVSGNPVIDVGSNIVDMTVANTYTGGAKQTFVNSASTAGLNLTASADHSTPASGDFWNSTTTANSLKYRDAASTTRTLVDLSLSQTLTNKSISGATNTLSAIPNSALTNSSITVATGTTGTDVGVSGSPVSLGGTVTLNIPIASGTNTGKLSSSDWITFNSKQSSGNYMTDPGGNGIVTRTALNTTINRTITGTTNRISLTNGDGVSGNPVIDVGSNIVDMTVANTYTGGAKQTFVNSASTAGLNLTASADHSTPASGDFWNSTTTANSLKYRDAASTTRTLVDLSLSQTLTNKSISGATNTLSAIPNSALTNSSITVATGTTGTDVGVSGSPVSLGGTVTLNIPIASGTNTGKLSSTDWTTFNNKGSGTVTSVSALTLGTTGTDLSSSVATSTTTPVITLNVPTASASNRGALSSSDWATFNNKVSSQWTTSGSNIYYNTGNVGIGSSTFNGTYPEKLLVDAGTTTSVNAIVGKGTINSYLQLNIQNLSSGTSASSDVVATADNGSETTNYVNMGINGSGNTSNVMGGANDAYFYNLGQNLLIGTGTTAKSLVFMTGGQTQSTNERMRIDGSGNVGIGVNGPTALLHLKAGTATASTAPLKFTAGTNLTTPENGALEYNGTNLFITNAGVRQTILTAGTLNNNRIMVSSGGSITEAAALTNGQLLIGSTGSAPTAATLTAGNGITITNGAGSITIANEPTITQVTATADATTTSTTDVLLTGMTITPGAGDYLVFFTGSVENTNSSKQGPVSIYSNGTQIAASVIQLAAGGGIIIPVATNAYITGLGAGQAIEVRWKVISNTGTFHQRTMIVQKVK